MNDAKAKHTPGPWFSNNAGYVFRRFDDGSLGGIVATTSLEAPYERNGTRLGANIEDRANARLIAAAPELLEALKAAESELSKRLLCETTLAIIHAALAKAERGDMTKKGRNA